MKELPKYDDELLQEINNNSDLIGYVSQFMELKQKGDNYYTSCPKHIDKTASLAFNGNAYHCFSCGRSGQMIGYLIDYEGLSFDAAVEKAASLSNVDLSKACSSPTIIMLKRMKMKQKQKTESCVHNILDPNELEKYQVEQVPEWKHEGIQQEIMDMFGVRIDNFSDRIVYPVYDIDGNLINIKGRTRHKNYKELRIAKYMNYYPVGVLDYFQGLNITLPYVKEKNEIILFESFKSVMKAYGFGYKNCASAENHSLSKEQIGLLIKLRADVVLAYDSDVDYWGNEIRKSTSVLKHITNLYIVQDTEGLLGGSESKNAPVDCGEDVWRVLYENKKKVMF